MTDRQNITALPFNFKALMSANENRTTGERLEALMGMLARHYDDIAADPAKWAHMIGEEFRRMDEGMRAAEDALIEPFRHLCSAASLHEPISPSSFETIYVTKEDYDRWRKCEDIIRNWHKDVHASNDI